MTRYTTKYHKKFHTATPFDRPSPLSSDSKTFCFHCRKEGHLLSKCPNNKQSKICYHCGEEHNIKDCKSTKKGINSIE